MAPIPAPVTDQAPLPTAIAKPKSGPNVPSWVIISMSIIFGLVLLWIVLGLIARYRAKNSHAKVNPATTSRGISEHRMHNWHEATNPASAAHRDDERLKNLMLETQKEFARQYGGWNPDKVFYQTGKSGEAAIYVNASRKAQERNHIGLVDTQGSRSDRTQHSVDRSMNERPPISNQQVDTQHSADRPMKELPSVPISCRASFASADSDRGRSRSASVPRAHPPTRRGTPHPRRRRSRTVGPGSYSETSKLTEPLAYRPPRFSIESAPVSEIMGPRDDDKNESNEKAPIVRFSPLLLALNLEDPHPTTQDCPPRVVTPERLVPEVEGTTDPHTRIGSNYGIISDCSDENPPEEAGNASSSPRGRQKDRAVRFHRPKSAPKEIRVQYEISQKVTPVDSDGAAIGKGFPLTESGSHGKTAVPKLGRVRTADEELDWPLPKSPPVEPEKMTKEAPKITIDLDSEPLDDSFMLSPQAMEFGAAVSAHHPPTVPARGSSLRGNTFFF